MSTRAFALGLLFSVNACASGGGAPSPAPPAGGEVGQNKMVHCPSAVEGAKTEIKDVDGGFEVTVTAAAEPAIGEIRKRAKHVGEVAKVDATTPAHTGEGAGGGGLGKCPTLMKDVDAAAADVDGGAKVSVKVRNAADLEAARKAARDRLAALGK
jgi:hypothetical protein